MVSKPRITPEGKAQADSKAQQPRIERSFILCDEGFIGLEHLPEEMTARGSARTSGSRMRAARELLEALYR